MLNLRKVGDNSHVPAVWFAAEPEDKRSNIRFVFYQEGIDMAAKKGASKTITFHITPELLKFYNDQLKYDWESGDFVIFIGPNSRDAKGVTVNWQK